jgi:hypothetical protein
MYVYKYETMWMTCLMYLKCVNVYRQCRLLLFSNMMYVCGLSCMMHVYVAYGFSCMDDIVYVVINILYVST